MQTSKVHCPKCGSQQMSGAERFCRACGQSLSGVRELVVPAEAVAGEERVRFRAAKRQGVILLLVCLLAAAVLTILQDIGLVPQILVKVTALGLLIAAMARIVYPYIAGPRRALDFSPPSLARADLGTNRLALGSPAASEMSGFTAARPREPTSVTEHTTRSLHDLKN